MYTATRHIDRFDLAGRQFFDSVEIAFTHLEVVFDNLTKRTERQMEFSRLFRSLGFHVEHQPFFTDRKTQMIRPLGNGPALARGQHEGIVFQQDQFVSTRG